MPQSTLEAADAPAFERYDERFDPHTGMGEVEIWVPVKAWGRCVDAEVFHDPGRGPES